MKEELRKRVDEIIAKFPIEFEEYKNGRKGLMGKFVGETMKSYGGDINPKDVNDMVIGRLNFHTTESKYHCTQADGKNGQAILDYFKGIKEDCTLVTGWDADTINCWVSHYVYLNEKGKLYVKEELPEGYTLIEI